MEVTTTAPAPSSPDEDKLRPASSDQEESTPDGERDKPDGDEEEHADGDADEKDESAPDSSMAVDIGRFFRYKWLPTRRAKQTTIQKMEMQQLQHRFEARELADIMRSHNTTKTSRRRDRRRRQNRSDNRSSEEEKEGDSESSSSGSSEDEREGDSPVRSMRSRRALRDSASDDDDEDSGRGTVALTRRRRERREDESLSPSAISSDNRPRKKQRSGAREGHSVDDQSSVVKKPPATTKCSLCNTYNSLRLCTKGMCSRCCPSDGDPCQAHRTKSDTEARSPSLKRSSPGSAGASTSRPNKRAMKANESESQNDNGTGTNNGEAANPSSGPLSSGVNGIQSQQRHNPHRKCALCHANNYLRLCPKAMCRVCCPKDGPVCSAHAQKNGSTGSKRPPSPSSSNAETSETTQATTLSLPKNETEDDRDACSNLLLAVKRSCSRAASPLLVNHEDMATDILPSTDDIKELPAHLIIDGNPSANHETSSAEAPFDTGSLYSANQPSTTKEEEHHDADNGSSTSLSASLTNNPDMRQHHGAGNDDDDDSTRALAFFLQNVASSTLASPSAAHPSSSPSPSLDSILAVLPSAAAAAPYALSETETSNDPSAGVKRKQLVRCVQCNSNNALGACPKSCCSLCCPKDGHRCPAHSHRKPIPSSSHPTRTATSRRRSAPAESRGKTSGIETSPSSSSPFAFNEATNDASRKHPSSESSTPFRPIKCEQCNAYNKLNSCTLNMCSICCHKSPRGPCAAHLRRSGEAPDTKTSSSYDAVKHENDSPTTYSRQDSQDASTLASMSLFGLNSMSSPDLSSETESLGERKPKPRGRPRGSTKKKKLEELARLARDQGGVDSDSDLVTSTSSSVYPAPSLPPPPLGSRALTRTADAPSRRAKQNTLARIRMQQWQDELEDEEHISSDDGSDSDESESDLDVTGSDLYSTDELASDEKGHPLETDGTSTGAQSTPKRKRGRPPKPKPYASASQTHIASENTNTIQGSMLGNDAQPPETTATAVKEEAEYNPSEDGAWADEEVEEIVVDDLLFFTCCHERRADFVKCLAEPTFLYAPKKAATRSTGSRSKRQSIRSPTGARCSNCDKPKSTSWREGWIPKGSTTPTMLCHSCGTRFAKEMYCTYCHYIYMADEDWNTTKWIGCDSCTKWIHKKCEERYVGHTIDIKAFYQCPTCRGETIDPPPPPVLSRQTSSFSD